MNRKERRAAAKSGRPQAAPNSFSDQLRELGDRHLKAGDLAEAESLYRQALAGDPADLATLHRLGHVATRSGRAEEALGLYRRALAINRRIPELHLGMAAACHATGNLAEAEAHCAEATRLGPDFAEAKLEHGNVLMELGRPAEAADCFHHVMQIRPDNAQASINLGNALHALGRPDDAIAAWRRAQAADPRHPLPAMNLGIALIHQGRHGEAIAEFRRASELAPDSVEALTNLAKAHATADDTVEAMQTIWRALAISETDDAKAVFVECLRRFRFTADMPELRGAVARAIAQAWGRLDDFNASATDLAKRKPALMQCVERVAAAWPKRLAGNDLWTPPEQSAICTDPLLRTLMESAPICDLDLERFLTSARRALLADALAATPAKTVAPELLAFHCALARQCFLNEYVYALEDEEAGAAQRLRQMLEQAIAAQAEIPLLWLAAAGTYAPLNTLASAASLTQRPWPVALTALITQQVSEPLEEKRLRASIPALTPIDDTVSLAVREQYEENPYPRWASLPLRAAPDTVEGALRALFPSLPAATAVPREGCDVLIAGCGTGHCAIEAAQRYRGARVLAVDLSLTSLAYAKRKTQEIEIESIDYAQADITRLGALARTFDVIEAGGVLHHLDDPFAGWRVLLTLLRPGGFMYLGLYSAFGRAHIVAVREVIEQRGYRRSGNDIRRFRQDLVDGDFPHVGRFRQSPDFYNMSGCRDLCFHVQEHRLTIPQIKAFIDENKLTFLGFVVDPKTRHAVDSEHPGEVHDLDRWHRYESAHPNLFSGQYHFWLQKPRG